MTDQVKRPAGGAYGQWVNQMRKEGLGKACPVVAKKASIMWKEMSDADKAPFQKAYEAQKASYDTYKAFESFEPPAKRGRTGDYKPPKKEKDADAPKRLVGGAYGMFQKANREEFTKEAAAKGYSGFSGANRIRSEKWKVMTEAQQGEWQKKYQAAKVQYEKDVQAYEQQRTAAKYPAKSPGKSPARSPGKSPAHSPAKSPLKPTGGA